jgi:hypothetical protein
MYKMSTCKITLSFAAKFLFLLLLASCDDASGNKVPVQTDLPQQATGQQERDVSMTYKHRNVKLIPFSGAVSYPRSKPRLQVESVNREKFYKIFQVDEITVSYTCVFNKRGLYSASFIDAVSPHRLFSLINDEFENSTGSTFNKAMCPDHGRASTLRSVDVSVSIIDQ